MVQDLVQLDGEQVIDLRDARVDHGLGVARDRHGALQDLVDELLHQVLAALPGRWIAGQPAFVDDLIEQARLDYLLLGRLGCG